MHIQSINNSNLNFNGSYCFKGPWTDAMRKTTEPFLEELAKGDKKIIAKMDTKRAIFDRFHHFGQKLYRPTLIATNENPTFIQKVKDFFGISPSPKTFITETFHRAKSTERLLKERLTLDDFRLRNYRWDLKIK